MIESGLFVAYISTFTSILFLDTFVIAYAAGADLGNTK